MTDCIQVENMFNFVAVVVALTEEWMLKRQNEMHGSILKHY